MELLFIVHRAAHILSVDCQRETIWVGVEPHAAPEMLQQQSEPAVATFLESLDAMKAKRAEFYGTEDGQGPLPSSVTYLPFVFIFHNKIQIIQIINEHIQIGHNSKLRL